MNEVIVSLQQKLSNMKSLVPTEAATPEQISKYFNETEELIDGILKMADSQQTASTTELEGIRESVKELRNLLKKTDSEMKPLTYRDVCYNVGKGLVAAWNKDAETLGVLKFCPNIRAENGTIRRTLNGKPEKALYHRRLYSVSQSETWQTMTSILTIRFTKRPSCRKLQSSL